MGFHPFLQCAKGVRIQPMGDRRSTPLRTVARPSPFRRPVLRIGAPRERPKIVHSELPASLPMTRRRAAGLALLGLASFAIVALQIWAIVR